MRKGSLWLWCSLALGGFVAVTLYAQNAVPKPVTGMEASTPAAEMPSSTATVPAAQTAPPLITPPAQKALPVLVEDVAAEEIAVPGQPCCEARIPVDTLPGSATAKHVISKSGSYYLRKNLVGVAGKNGIEILAKNVSLDLNGFALQGVPNSLSGILIAKNVCTVENGTICWWEQYGIMGESESALTIRNVKAYNNPMGGILAGYNSTISDCTTDWNTEYGIKVVFGGRVLNCSTTASVTGIWVGQGCEVVNSTASFCDVGIYAEARDIIENCSAYTCYSTGIRAEGNAIIRSCSVVNGVIFGIEAYNGCEVSGCTIFSCGNAGIITEQSRIIGNTIQDSGKGDMAGAGHGIELSWGGGSAVSENVLINNNIGLSIWADSNRIENNKVHGSEIGIELRRGHDNLIVKNQMTENNVDLENMSGHTNMIGTLSSDPATAGPWANFVGIDLKK